MAKRTRKAQPEARRPKNLTDGQRTYPVHDKVLVTHRIGALPILNRLLGRMRLDEFFTRHLPPEDNRSSQKNHAAPQKNSKIFNPRCAERESYNSNR